MDPITRKETFLAKAGGQDVNTPTPVTREEYFLNEIAKGGGSGGGGVLVVHDSNGTLDKTWQEIYDAWPFAVLDDPSHSARNIFDMARTDLHGLFAAGGNYYAANSASGYPEKTNPPK